MMGWGSVQSVKLFCYLLYQVLKMPLKHGMGRFPRNALEKQLELFIILKKGTKTERNEFKLFQTGTITERVTIWP